MMIKTRNYMADMMIEFLQLIILIVSLTTTNWIIFETDLSIFEVGLYTFLYNLNSNSKSSTNSISINDACKTYSTDDTSWNSGQLEWDWNTSVCDMIYGLRKLIFASLVLTAFLAAICLYLFLKWKNVNFIRFHYVLIFLDFIKMAVMISIGVIATKVENYMCHGDFDNVDYENCNLGFSYICPIIVLLIALVMVIHRILSTIKARRMLEDQMSRSLTGDSSIVSYHLDLI